MRNSGKRLAAAVIEQALRDYKNLVGVDEGDEKHSRLLRNYEDSKRWFKAKGRGVFGYYWCLEVSGVNPNSVRDFLKMQTDLMELE